MFWTQYWIMTTPRDASGPGSGGSATIFAGGSGVVSGITWASPQLSVTLCAAALIENSAVAEIVRTVRKDVAFRLMRFRIAILFSPLR
jgi:dihydrodipicolinate synthase/N-acetylneuraminate lyase